MPVWNSVSLHQLLNECRGHRLIKKLFCVLQFLLRFKYGNYEAVTKSPQQEKADLRSKGGISSLQ